MSLQFTAFDIVRHSYCGYDHLTIMDGDGTNLMQKSCGSSSYGYIYPIGNQSRRSLPATITSRTNTVKLVFSTDGGDTKTGWSVEWTAVTPGLEALFEISAFDCITIF